MAGKERNENSVLISIDDLTSGSPNQSGTAKGPGRDESGLIDLQGLENSGLVGRKGGDVDSPSSAQGFEPSSSLRVAPQRQGPGVGLIVGVALGTVLVLGGGVALGIKFFGGEGEAGATTAQGAGVAVPSGAPSAAVPSAATSMAVAGSTATSAGVAGSTAMAGSAPGSTPESLAAAPASAPGSEGDDEAEGDDKPGKTPGKPNRPAGTRPTKRNAAAPSVAAATEAPKALAAKEPPKRSSEVDDMLGALDGSKKPVENGGGGGRTTELPPDPTLPPSLSRQQIMSVVTSNAAGVRKCTQEVGGGTGTALVELVINASGNVTDADVVGGELKGTPLGECVSRKVKVFRFAQFNGDPMRIKMPFRL